MIRNNRFAFALIGAFAIGGTGMLYAQSHKQDKGPMGEMAAACPMMDAAAEGPGAILEHADTLDLTAEQTARLQSLREQVEEARRSGAASMRELHSAMPEAAMGEEFDEAAVRDAFRRMGDLHGEMAVRMLQARHTALHLLDTRQRDLLAELRAEAAGNGSMHGMHGMHRMHEMMGTGDTTGMPGMRGMHGTDMHRMQGMMEMHGMMGMHGSACPMMQGRTAGGHGGATTP